MGTIVRMSRRVVGTVSAFLHRTRVPIGVRFSLLGGAAPFMMIGLAACGATTSSRVTSSASNAQLSPQQYETARRVAAYIPAIDKIMASTSRPPAHPRDIAHGYGLIRTQIAQLEGLTPAPGFGRFQRDLMRALKGELAVEPQLAAALRSNDPIALSNAQARVDQAGGRVRTALAEAVTKLARCKASTASSFEC
jgi:hypothetical protein